ncbi:MAG: SHOCT domain-containing protein [Anaerolineae bacterium]
MMGFGLLGMLLLWGIPLALIAGGAVWLWRQFGEARPSTEVRGKTARQVLDERFARGEIGREEYEAIRARIEER